MRPSPGRALMLGILLVALPLAGCTGSDDEANNGDGTDGTVPTEPTAEIPRWDLGDAWTYTVRTENFPEAESTMIVYGDDGNNYLIGTTDRRQALIHALFNVNPQLGRIQKGNLAVYEDGEPRPMYDFPLTDGHTWQTDFFVSQHGGTLNAEATYNEAIDTAMGPMEGFEVRATNQAGFEVVYDYILETQWFSKLVVTRADGTVLHELRVQQFNEGASGTGWFVRGDDIFEEGFGPAGGPLESYDRQVLVDGASAKGGQHGAYDLVAFNVQVDIGSDNDRAEVTITDGNGDQVYSRNFLQSQQDEFRFDVTREFEPGEWDITVRLSGSATAQVRLAGAWEFSGEV